jgi:transcription elongation factor Elf1
MEGLQTLIKQARDASRFRGHKMSKFAIWHGESKSIANSSCKKCGAWVQCNTRPLPNGIDLGGPAVAVNCGNYN